MASIEIIEYSRILESEASTKQWGWLFHTYIQWHAIAYILGELTIRPHSMIVDRAWRAVDTVFNEVALSQSKHSSGMLWQPMRKLMVKARRKREENLQVQIQQGRISSDLGINSKYIRPPPSGPTSRPGNGNADIARDRQYPQTSDPSNVNNGFSPDLNTPASTASLQSNNFNTSHGAQEAGLVHHILSPSITMSNSEPQIPSQVIGMGPSLAPEQVQLQMQQQQQQLQQPWLMDESGLLGLDMAGLEGDPNWEGWDDLVRDFQMDVDNQGGLGEIRGPTLGGMGTWW